MNKEFSSLCPDGLCGHTASCAVGTGGFLAGQVAGREGDHSPACNAEVKNAWSIPLYSLEFIHGVVCHNARVQFYLSLWEY